MKRSILSASLLGAIGVVIAGCEVGPNYKAPAPNLTPAYREATTRPTSQPVATMQAVDLVHWWTTLHDPELNSLIARAAEANLDLQAAAARVRQARAERGVVASSLFPTVNATGSYSHSLRSGGVSSSSSFNTNGTTGGTTTTGGGTTTTGGGTTTGTGSTVSAGGGSSASPTDLYEAGFDATWEIDVFGGIRRQVESSDASIQAAVEDLRDVQVTLLAEVATDYITLRGLQHQLEFTYENARTQRDTLDLTNQKFKAGLASRLDVAQVEALVATTEAQVPQVEAQVRQQIHALGTLLAVDPGALTDELMPSANIPLGPPQIPPGIPSDLLRRRPDIRRAERQLAAATANVGVAVADLFPRFSLTGSLGLESNKFKNTFNYGSRFYSIGPSVSWPILDFGRIRSNIDVQNALQQQALLTYQKTVLTGLQEVDDSLVTYAKEQDRRQALEAAVDADQRAVDLAKDLWRNGLTDFLQVLTAEQNLFIVQNQLAQSQTAVSTDLVALYKALGGGWE